MRKTVIVLGGPNGAGKTTFAKQLFGKRLPDEFEFLNADMIAEGMSPFRPEKAAIRAGREFISRIVEKGRNEESFALESTLSGLGLARRLSQLRLEGYRIEMLYFWLPNADLAVNRVQKRVQRGGHSIPEETIRRRFVRSNSNFVSNYRQIVDHWVLLDAASTPPSKIASWGRGSSIKIEQPGHAVLSGLEGETDSVQEETTEYGSENRFYTENLDDVITSVGEFLLNQETFEELVSEEWIKPTSYTLGSSE